jgi:hypothetical protein
MRSRVLGILALVLAACSPMDVFDEYLTGPYHLVAIDTQNSLHLVRKTGPSGAFGDGLPPIVVAAAGYNKNYIVLAGHPESGPFDMQRDVDHYYYIERRPDEADRVDPAAVKGPLDFAAYQAEKTRLGLPEFSRHFVGNTVPKTAWPKPA